MPLQCGSLENRALEFTISECLVEIMKRHEWRERSEEGEVRIFRATKHGGIWTLQSKQKGDEFWNRHDPLSRADILIIRAMLERKYQRNRVPFEDLDSINKWLEKDQLQSQQATDAPNRNRPARKRRSSRRRKSPAPNVGDREQ